MHVVSLVDVSGKMHLALVLLLLTRLCSFALPELDSQEDALYALKLSLNASSKQLTNWNKYLVTPCTWSNVECDQNNNVVRVSLEFMGFTGSLTPRIGALKSLTTLSLQGNSITGDIPKEVGNLTSLVRLDLENNKLTGH
ncbi:LRR receptor serine/threonine-protein kinase [Spatholobus suberectus]|nr:LRR receptor serine/threonine-protein kinase [Spatholobus suberectus]